MIDLRSTRRAALAASCLAALPFAAAQAQEAPPEAFAIDESGWTGGAFARPGTQQFSHCGIERAYEETTLVLSLNRRNELSIAVADPGFAFTPESEPVPVELTIDETGGGQALAIPGGEDVLIIQAGQNDSFVEALRRGYNMRIAFGEDVGDFTFPLSGTFNALPALQECIQTANELLPEQAQGPRPMTRTALNQLLQTAGLEDVAFAAPEQIPDDDMGLSHAWQLGALIGGLAQSPRLAPDIQINEFREEYIAVLENRCDGEFSSEQDEAEIILDTYAVAYSDVTCTAEAGDSFMALFYTLDDNFYSVFFHEGAPEDQDVAREATRAIGSVITELARSVGDDAEAEEPEADEDADAQAAEPEPETAEGEDAGNGDGEPDGDPEDAAPAEPEEGAEAPAAN